MTLRSDQREVAERLLQLLRSNAAVGLMAPTGWGKSYTLAYVAKSIGGKWLWATPLISIEYTVSQALKMFGIEHIISAGRERLCSMGFSNLDFRLRNVCMSCSFNRPPDVINNIIGSIDFSAIRDIAETNMICPYLLQEEVIRRKLRRSENIVILLNYKRIQKFIKYTNFIIVDEAHSLGMPKVTRLPRRVVEVLFHDVLGIDADTRNAEAARAILAENLLNLAMSDSDLNVDLNTLIDFIDSQFVYYDQTMDELIGVHTEGLSLPQHVKTIFVSATLPPSILQGVPTIRVQPSVALKVRIPRDAIAVTLESMQRRKEKVAELLRRYLLDSTIIFTTSSKDVTAILDTENLITEDEVGVNVCEKPPPILVLNFYGKFSEGARLTCFKRAILLTVPLLPRDIMQRLRIKEEDLITVKTVQVIGRLLPQPEEPDIIMLDRRYWQYCQYLQQYGIQCVED